MEKTPKHPANVIGYNGSLPELASAIGNMSYDKLAIFIEELSEDIKKQSEADLKKGHPQLSKKLLAASKKLLEAKKEIDSAWKISKPFM